METNIIDSYSLPTDIRCVSSSYSIDRHSIINEPCLGSDGGVNLLQLGATNRVANRYPYHIRQYKASICVILHNASGSSSSHAKVASMVGGLEGWWWIIEAWVLQAFKHQIII